MKARSKHRFLCALLAVLMIVSLLPTAALAAEVETSTWEKVDFDKITAEDVVAITMTKGDVVYVLPAEKNTSKTPTAAIGSVSDDTLALEGAEADFGWTITKNEGKDTYSIINQTGDSLYVINSNSGVRVGATVAEWKLDQGFLTAQDTQGNTRYMGVYATNPDWRCYKTIDNNIKDETLGFWKLTGSSSGEQEVTITPIADAKAATSGSFTVKGVVTMIENKNVFVQDATGGICLYLTAAPTDLALGDTVVGSGTRGVHNGLQQLSNATYTKDTGLTLMAKETTIGALTTADVCTYVKLKDLEVTEVYDNNGGYSNPNITVKDADGKTIQIYKAVVDKVDGAWAVKVGDKIDVKAAVGVHNTTLQLRNTLASEITVQADPYADIAKNLSVYERTDALADGDRILIVNTANNKTLTTEPAATYYLAGADVAPQDLNDTKVIALDNDAAEWTVSANENGTYGLTQGDNTLAGNREEYVDKNGNNKVRMNITLTADDSAEWKPVDFGESGVFLVNTGLESASNGNVSLEWHNGRFCLYDVYGGNEAANAAACAVTFYKLVREKTVETPETPTASPAAGAVEANTEVTFSCATEGAVISYSTDNGKTWTEGTTFTVTEAVTLLVKAVKDGAESEVATFAYRIKQDDPDPQTGLVTDLSQLTDGAYVVIYHPDSGLAMTSETYRDWYIMPAAATIEDGKAVDPAANQVWKVGVGDDGSYTFTQGSHTVAAWLNGNFVELTTNGSYNADTKNGWKLDVCNAANSTFYMSSSTLTTSYGKAYVEVFGKKVNNVEGTKVFCGYSTGEDKLNEAAYGLQFYLVDEPETPVQQGDLITNLDDLDGKTVAIYSPSHQTAISSKPNGDWYLRAKDATVKGGKIVNFTSDFVWKVQKNDDGTYTFISNDDPTKSIAVWISGDYAEITVNSETYPENKWTLSPHASTPDAFVAKSPTVSHATKGSAYLEAYVRNESQVFSGYFTKNVSSADFALQFYLVNPENAVSMVDDGTWDGVLQKGEQYAVYNVAAESAIGLLDEANFSMKAIPSTVSGDKLKAGNGAYVFTVDTMGRYYTFMTNGKFLATNEAEELLLIAPNADGSAPETAKWFLTKKDGGYILYNKEAYYNGTPVCVEYYSSVFSGWTFSTKNPLDIYLFNFYKLTDDAKVYQDIVQDPQVLFDGEDIRYIEQDYAAEVTLDDLAPEITNVKFSYIAGDKTGEITNVTGSDRNYSFTIPAAYIDSETGLKSFVVRATVTNSYGITYTGEKTVQIVDEPFFSAMTPRPNSQTRDDMCPTISVKVGNVGDNPTFVMEVNGKTVEATFENGVLSYKPDADLPEGRTTVYVSVERADGVTAEKNWAFIAGYSEFQHYFGQLHSHTTYSDGSGSLETALDYVANLPERANVQFVAFTDHSNYFDSASAANPADALNDKSLMTDASRDKWNEYKSKVAAFNAKQTDVVAIAGFEMTWSGGPGHINTYDSDGLVSRNNAALNNKTSDAGMKLYYDTINKGNSLNQFNHPGTTFGNFSDFNYWSEETDAHMFLVEVGNGEGQIGQGGYYPSYEQYILALDKGWHVAPTNNQDNHKGRWGNANDARDVVLADDFSEQGIYDAIRKLRVYATEDKNLDLNYTVNEQPMGTIFSETPEKLDVVVDFYDPDSRDKIVKVELVANSGKVAYTWDKSSELATGEVTTTIENPKFTYYFVRVTQKDGNLAVTAPVWVGKGINVGIQDVKCVTEQPLVNKDVTLTTTLFNAQDTEVTVKSLTYTTDGSIVLKTDATEHKIPANGSIDVDFTYKPKVAKRTTVKVTAVIVVNDIELTYTKDVTFSVRENAGELPVTAIKGVQAQTESGYEYAIEGVVTSNASGYDKDTAFFDCIYVQDDTAGICCFPVSGEYKIGDKVHIEGYTDFYQGEAELQVEKIEVIGSGSVAPTETTAAAVNDGSVLGSLITVKGTVESFEVVNGLVQTIMVKDENGDVVRVFIDGYITTGREVENLAVGCVITVTGLASYDDTFNAPEGPFPRIRIRDRADVVCTPTGCDGGENCPSIQFEDVDRSPDSWSHEPIDWAVVNEITVGTSATTFSPNNECTRGEAVTFLWRAAHCPEPKTTENPFTDVADDAFYLKPVLWAVENEITLGTGGGKFSPDDKCTRSQIVTFLWRMHEKPEAEEACTFADVSADDWFFDAVSWAVENGITKGTSKTTFEPHTYCIRSQIVAFLYRDFG